MSRSQSVNFANITRLFYNGTELNRLNLNGSRRWERVWVPSTTQVLVSQGYWVDPPGYYEDYEIYRYPVGEGRWDPNDVDGDGEMWPDGEPTEYRWIYVPSEPDYWIYEIIEILWGTRYVDPPPYWVDTSYYQTVDNSYWAYYY